MGTVTGTMVSVQTARFSEGLSRRRPFSFFRKVERHDTEREEGGLQIRKTSQSCGQAKNITIGIEGGASPNPSPQHHKSPVRK
jgi:hypothetical protein